jgi:integrase
MGLTQRQIDGLRPAGDGLIATGYPQLYVRMGRRGHSFILKYKREGTQHKQKIGDTRFMSLRQAIDVARVELAKLSMGQNPAKERAASKVAPKPSTLGELVPTFIAAKRDAGRATSTIDDFNRYLGRYAKPLHSRPVQEITRADISSLIESVQKRHKSKAVALLLSRNLSSFFSWCERRGLVEHSPARNVEKPEPSAPRDRHLSPQEIGTVWRGVQDAEDDWSRIIALLLLTGARRNEIAEIMWSEIDLDAGVINFDPSRIKTRNQHRLPITDQMRRILTKGEVGAGYVFGQLDGRPYSGFSKGQARLLKRLPNMPRWSPHDLRRTFQTRMAEEGLAEERVMDSIVNHAVQGVKRHYDYSQFMDQKRTALEAWGRYVIKCADAVKPAVVELEIYGDE